MTLLVLVSVYLAISKVLAASRSGPTNPAHSTNDLAPVIEASESWQDILNFASGTLRNEEHQDQLDHYAATEQWLDEDASVESEYTDEDVMRWYQDSHATINHDRTEEMNPLNTDTIDQPIAGANIINSSDVDPSSSTSRTRNECASCTERSPSTRMCQIYSLHMPYTHWTAKKHILASNDNEAKRQLLSSDSYVQKKAAEAIFKNWLSKKSNKVNPARLLLGNAFTRVKRHFQQMTGDPHSSTLRNMAMYVNAASASFLKKEETYWTGMSMLYNDYEIDKRRSHRKKKTG